MRELQSTRTNETNDTMPTLKPDTSAAYLLPASNPINAYARAKRDAEVRQNCYAIAKLLIFSAISGALLAIRK